FLSVSHPGYPPLDNLAPGSPGGRKSKLYTRAFQNMILDFQEEPVPGGAGGEARTRVTCYMQVDLGGYIPRWLFKRTVGRTGVMAFKALREQAVKMSGRGSGGGGRRWWQVWKRKDGEF
ncbi:hypothetical protein TeGR_g11762, partial [Tetraparma gracilis]